MQFINHYHCPRCEEDWTDIWDAMCDDDCPHCGYRHISPFNSEDLPAAKPQIDQQPTNEKH